MKKTAIIYGQLHSGVQMKAVEVLSRFLLDYTQEYPVCFPYDGHTDRSAYRCIYIGTKCNNPYIAENSKAVLTQSEAYSISVTEDTVIIEGYDDAGVLYGCVDFYNKYIIRFEFPGNDRYCVNFFGEKLPDFAYSSAPSVKNRGIWTWGHVIYDFRSFIDHMVMLKMNTLIIWNDFVPVNAKEMIGYAHSCGIRILWGFAWGWDTNCKNLSLVHLNDCSEEIFLKYEKEYAELGGDGIYFQSVTEVKEDRIGGILVAEAVTEFVNQTSGLFFAKYPELEIQFGLHATSVKNRLDFIRNVDPRIRIVWEDCGAFPFSYVPKATEDFDGTKAFVKDIAVLRGKDDRFGAVTKGLTKLDWSRFEHLGGSAFLGTGTEFWKQNRVVRKSKIWKYLQSCWLTHADKALEMVKTMAESKNGDLYITALVEDGVFEENIMYPVALYSEMLWNCHADLQEMISEVALRNHVTFA